QQDLHRVIADRARGALPPAPAAGADRVALVDEDHLAGIGMVGCAAAEVAPAFVATGEPYGRRAGPGPLVESGDRQCPADADEIRKVGDGVDRRQLAAFRQAPEERLRRRAVLRWIDAERPKGASPRGKRRHLA